jgi:hypothetical protein
MAKNILYKGDIGRELGLGKNVLYKGDFARLIAPLTITAAPTPPAPLPGISNIDGVTIANLASINGILKANIDSINGIS